MRIGLLWLEGPLQSWGHDSRFGRRATLPFPTRSGILGMLCCALGRGGEQREWLEKMRSFREVIVAYARNDRQIPPLLRDFHMVGSGYDAKDPWQDRFILKKSDGGRPSNSPGSKITSRHYLQDMAFACALELPDDEDIGEALLTPVWPVCLGRKCCVPTDIIWRGYFATFEEAVAKADEIAVEKNRHEVFLVEEGSNENGESMLLNDVPVCFGPYKEYASRYVTYVQKE